MHNARTAASRCRGFVVRIPAGYTVDAVGDVISDPMADGSNVHQLATFIVPDSTDANADVLRNVVFPLTPEQKLRLISQLYTICYDAFETFQDVPVITKGLCYLVGAITDGGFCDYSSHCNGEDDFSRFLRKQFRPQHPIWHYVRTDDNLPLILRTHE